MGRGIGRLLYEAVESKAAGLKLDRIFADVSITARPFFEGRGFSVLRKQTVTRGGIELCNFRMEKVLPSSMSDRIRRV
jgi:putative acetyltransferase